MGFVWPEGLTSEGRRYEVCCIRGLCWDWHNGFSRLLVRVHWRGYFGAAIPEPLSIDLIVSEAFHIFVFAVFAGGFTVHPDIMRALKHWVGVYGGSGDDAQ
jgi:hypothetical protein